ncbi:MAG: DNA repair protein RecN [Verrucomicrobia bacterium]|nr:DNA repair protein RecN [Verrucomicrobiota bacterium]
MLTTLRVRNLALVAELTIEVPPGLVVVTGETGAGKSIILGALNLVLGERADRTLIRSGAEACSVEAVFDVARLGPRITEVLEANGIEPCEDHQLLLKRTFTAVGTNRQFINGTPTTLAVLAEVGDWLVDIHGPHDHQSLLQPTRQRDLLDAFARLESEVAKYDALVHRRGEIESAKAALVVDERTYAQQLDLLRFQVNEIATARLVADEDVSVEQEHQRVSNAARLLELAQSALAVVSGDESSVLNELGVVGRCLQELRRLDAGAASLTELHAQAMTIVRELQTELDHYLDRVDLDPDRLQQLEERLNVLQSLKRKYGPSLGDVIRFGEDAASRLRQLESRDAELARLNAELAAVEDELWAQGERLTKARKAAAPKLAQAIRRQLTELGFRQSDFQVGIESLTRGGRAGEGMAWLPRGGLDTVEFLFAPNPGEPPRALRAIASSGEMARVMLAVKTVLAAEDQVPVLVFDEVDANVGGETAHAVGDKMRQIARRRQVFCITHLPQVAAAAGAHFVVEKEVEAGRSVSKMRLIEGPDRVTEIARMLGGQSKAARQHAAALLQNLSGK